MPRRESLCLMMSLVVMAGCSSPAPQGGAPAGQAQPPAAATTPAEPQRYDLKGKIVSVDKAGLKVTVDHEAITGFMGAMTMAYPVKDAQLLENLTAGQQVTATMVLSGIDYWLESIAVVAPAAPTVP